MQTRQYSVHKSCNVNNVGGSGSPSPMGVVHCLSNINRPNGYFGIASTEDTHTTVLFSALVKHQNRQCILLQILSSVDSHECSRSSHSTSTLCLAKQHGRGKPTHTAERPSMDQVKWIPRMLPSQGGSSTAQVIQSATAVNTETPIRLRSLLAN